MRCYTRLKKQRNQRLHSNNLQKEVLSLLSRNKEYTVCSSLLAIWRALLMVVLRKASCEWESLPPGGGVPLAIALDARIPRYTGALAIALLALFSLVSNSK